MTDLLADRAPAGSDRWVDVVAAQAVPVDRGVAVLVAGRPIALFRLAALDGGDEQWCAVDHIDPRTAAPVIARGLVGSLEVDGALVPTIASPLHKQRYDLRTGQGVAGESTALATWEVEIVNGRVMVAAP